MGEEQNCGKKAEKMVEIRKEGEQAIYICHSWEAYWGKLMDKGY